MHHHRKIRIEARQKPLPRTAPSRAQKKMVEQPKQKSRETSSPKVTRADMSSVGAIPGWGPDRKNKKKKKKSAAEYDK